MSQVGEECGDQRFPVIALQLPWYAPSVFAYSCDNDKQAFLEKPISHAQDRLSLGNIPEIMIILAGICRIWKSKTMIFTQ